MSAAAQSSDAAQAGDATPGSHSGDVAPGHSGPEHGSVFERIRGYVFGLILAALLTAASFTLHLTGLVYGPGLPVALLVLAVAQMGVHIVFFLHVTTGPDNTNNVLALAFGVLIVGLVVVGSLWIMANLDHNMKPMSTDGQPPAAAAPAGGHGGHRR